MHLVTCHPRRLECSTDTLSHYVTSMIARHHERGSLTPLPAGAGGVGRRCHSIEYAEHLLLGRHSIEHVPCAIGMAGEGRAVALADGVHAGEDDELLHGEVLPGDVCAQLLHLVGGVRELRLGFLGLGDAAVKAADGDVEVAVAVAEDAGGVTASIDQQLSAGGDVRTPLLDGGFGLLPEVTSGEADVHGGLLLRVRVVVGLVEEHRGCVVRHNGREGAR
ncbi:hypothetical protein BS78_10G147600 [Paspalum vaginatum]|nr:hypothetical protein BS78_10G147600 [Paspalum vaginatum]